MKRIVVAVVLAAAAGLFSTSWAADKEQSVSPDRQLPPKVYVKGDKIVAPSTKMMSEQEQCQWDCWNATSSCPASADSNDCNAIYQACLQSCG